MLLRLLVIGIALFVGAACDDAVSAEITTDPATCPQCAGEGTVPCPAHCKDGKSRCSESCLKKDDPGWVPGPEGKTVKYFPLHKKGMNGNHWWSTAHIGQLIVYEDGVPVDKGPCPTCHGTSVIDCKVCKGTGRATCPLCKGAKQVATAKAQEYAANHAATQLTLNDGRTLTGKIVGHTATAVMIKLDGGEIETIAVADIASGLDK